MRSLLLLALAVLASSCATIYTGTKQIIHFDSSEQGAEVYLNKKKIGITPFTYEIKRKAKNQAVMFKKDGYYSCDTILKKKFKILSLCSQVFIPVDLISGAAFKYKEEYINADLKSENEESRERKSSFYVVKNSGDTIYSFPNIKWKSHNLSFTDVNERENSISCKDVDNYFDLSKGWNGIFYGFFSIKFSNYYTMDKYSVIPVDSTKKKIIYGALKEITQNNEYKILQDVYSIYNYSAANGGSKTTYYKYFLFKGKEKQVEIKNKNCLEIARKYFSNDKELISMLEDKSKIKVFDKYYRKKYEGKNRFVISPF